MVFKLLHKIYGLRKIRFTKSSVIIFIVLSSCIDPFVYHVSVEKNLVIDGMITDQPGPYTVLLYYSKRVGTEIYLPEKCVNCKTTIESDAGEMEYLNEVTPGKYQTTSIRGVVGRTYWIKVITTEGYEYISEPETMQPIGEMVNLYNEFVQVEDPKSTDYIDTKNGFNLYVDTEVLPEQKHHIRWRWSGTYEILTYPEYRTKTVVSRDGLTVTHVPDPPLCASSYTCGGCCICCNCWVSTKEDDIHLSNESLNGSAIIKREYIGFVPASRRLLYTKYKIQVDQMSVTDNVYSYWRRIETQTQTGSDLFQTPPPKTEGNIRALSPDAPQAFGIFSASAIKTRVITIYHEDVPYAFPSIDTIAESCKLAILNATTERPPNW